MAYTILVNGHPAPIKIIEYGQVFEGGVCDWKCDPCAPVSERYTVEGQPFGWWEVATIDDSDLDVFAKIRHSFRIMNAKDKLAKAQTELNHALRGY